MTLGSLFSGIGGFELGLLQSGLITEVKWQVEIDGYCRKVLEWHFPETKRYVDIRDCGEHNLEPVDVICGGFPCQPFSVAGKRKGKGDDRHLWPEMLRICRSLQPALILVENVPGLLSMAESRSDVRVEGSTVLRTPEADYYDGVHSFQERMLFGAILDDLEEAGYWTLPLVIPACAVGANHRRDRVFVIAYNPKSRSRGLSVQPGRPRQASDDVDGNGKGTHADSNNPETARQRKYSGEILPITEAERFDLRIGTSADASCELLDGSGRERRGWAEFTDSGYYVECTDGKLRRLPSGFYWSGRMDDGRGDRIHKLRALGNAVHVGVAYEIGTIIKEWMEEKGKVEMI